MSIRLRDLKTAKEQMIAEKRLHQALSAEVSRVIGTSVQTERRSIEQICDDLLYLTEGQRTDAMFKPSLLTRLSKHSSAKVRRVAARFIDTSLLESLAGDSDVGVLYEVSTRAHIDVVKSIARKNRLEEHIQTIYEERLAEATKPKSIDDIDPEVRRSIEAQSHDDDVLDDFWYDEMARKIFDMYGNTTDTGWVRIAVAQQVNAVSSMLGIPVDASKLLETLNKLLEERDEAYIKYHDVLKVTVENLQRQTLRESFHVRVDEEPDADEQILEGRHSSGHILETCERRFNIKKEACLSRRLKGLLIAEGITANNIEVPVAGTCSPLLGESDESMLNAYVEAWSRSNEPLQLEWTQAEDGVSFNVSVWGIN